MTKYLKNRKISKTSKSKKRFTNIFNKKIIGFLLLITIGISLVTYLVQINNVTTKGYEIRALEDEIAQLKDENQKLQLQLVEMQSMNHISNKVAEMNFVEVDKIKYLDTSSTSLVQR